MRFITLIIFFSTILFQLAAQETLNTVRGRINTAGGDPVAGVSVFLAGTRYSAVTDKDGEYLFNLPSGKYQLIVSSFNKEDGRFDFEVKGGYDKVLAPIIIVERDIRLREVVVTGYFKPQSLHRSVYKIDVITPEKIRRKAAIDVQSLLSTESGIRLSNDMMLGETDLELMGMGGNSVKVLIDGVPAVDRGSAKQSLSQIDINSIERVEIVNGPMSVVYGSDALAGVINVITKNPIMKKEGRGRYLLSFRGQEESVGNSYNILIGSGSHYKNIYGTATHKSGLNLSAGFTKYQFGGWEGDKIGGEKLWLPKLQYLSNVRTGYATDNLNLYYGFSSVYERITSPLNVVVPTERVDRNFHVTRFNHNLQVDWQINSEMSLNIAASSQNYSRRSETVIMDIETGQKWLSLDPSAQDLSGNRMLFARAVFTWQVIRRIGVQTGVDYQYDRASGDRIKGGVQTIRDYAAYVTAEYIPVEWLSIRSGLRSVINSDYAAPTVIPAFNLKLNITEDIDLRLAYAQGFRSPKLRELYFSFHNSNHNIDGNSELKAEKSNNINASFTWRSIAREDLKLSSTLSGFYNNFHNRITLAADIGDPSHNTYYNIERYRTLGVVIEGALEWKDLNINLNFAYIGRCNYLTENNSNLRNGGSLFSPELSLNVNYFWKRGETKFSLFYKFFGTRQDLVLGDNRDRLMYRSLQGYNWSDITVSKRIGRWVTIETGIKNLFDVITIESRTTTDDSREISFKNNIGTGRSYFLGLRFEIGN